MFRGRVTPSSRSGLWSRRLTGAASPTEVRRAPHAILCSKYRKGKISHPAGAGCSLTTDPLHWTQKWPKSSAVNGHFSRNWLHPAAHLMLYSVHSADTLRSIRPRRGGRAAECGGLLIHPDLFVLIDIRLFCLRYMPLSCTNSPHLLLIVQQVFSNSSRVQPFCFKPNAER